jgi:hypothetical protein
MGRHGNPQRHPGHMCDLLRDGGTSGTGDERRRADVHAVIDRLNEALCAPSDKDRRARA